MIQTPLGEQPEMLRTPRPAQLHTLGKENQRLDKIEYAAEWVGKSPWVIVLAGDRGNAQARVPRLADGNERRVGSSKSGTTFSRS